MPTPTVCLLPGGTYLAKARPLAEIPMAKSHQRSVGVNNLFRSRKSALSKKKPTPPAAVSQNSHS
jgi:hypothetical protein